jgi:ribulose-phosphate 3-epimerase
MIQIAPSILSANFIRLAEEIQCVEAAGASLIHLDVMDGHFVPNITFGPPVVAAVRKATTLPLDVHLMIEKPDAYIEPFVKAGADWISVHVEACVHLDRTIQLIRSYAVKAGVVLNPATPISLLHEVLSFVDHILVMSVNPGFGGQKFIPNSLEKIKQLRKVVQQRGLSVKIEVDGGVGLDNLCDLISSGAEILVSGSQIFGSENPGEAVKKMIGLSERCFPDKQI